MKIAFLGFGNVGGALADQLARAGHKVTLGARDASSTSVQEALARNPKLLVASPKEAVAGAEAVFLATPYAANEAAIRNVLEELRGKVLVDCTNPVGAGLTHGLGSRTSGSEELEKIAPETRVVKAFTIYGYENFEDNRFPESSVAPAMFYCGRDAEAKKMVGGLIRDLGWEPLDTGGMEQALHLEHMTLLWIRMVRMGGASPHTVWAVLRR
jgi:hypothetical protein